MPEPATAAATLLNPGGRLRPVPARADPFWNDISPGRLCPLVVAAAPLLTLCVQLRQSLGHADVDGLRDRVLAEIEAFERRIVPLGLAPRSVRAARYALSATIDDVVLNTPWGSRSLWTRRGIVSTLFSETWGGDRFFDLLAQLKREPALHVDLLELLYCCLSLGFEGRLRLSPRGATELAALREDLHGLIRAARGSFERDLSPRWRGVAAERRLGAAVPGWLVVVVTLGGLALLHGGLLLALNARSDIAFAELGNLPPRGAIGLSRVAPPPPPPPPRDSAAIRSFLEPEIREGLVTVTETAQNIAVTIRGAGIFASARATVEADFVPLFERIGEALNDQPGDVLITGHTDSAPIRSVAFPSNFQLSLARAQAAARITGSHMQRPDRLRVEGRGAAEPVAPNETEEGRRQNRRIEFLINKPV
ncbi:type VI secretion system protein TssL [Roseomonas marmotae]|uniref:Type VI secretion system protein TssL n=2 Tax=Roseomonas marmotae TaxID=2768161 RepID=A0ABS3K896_9PROT|nr:type VI secretion system protein TssL [Roseomonas marmotae]QTI80985.1 type VI secretion system protein TssL [Roseomonas marmotae]